MRPGMDEPADLGQHKQCINAELELCLHAVLAAHMCETVKTLALHPPSQVVPMARRSTRKRSYARRNKRRKAESKRNPDMFNNNIL